MTKFFKYEDYIQSFHPMISNFKKQQQKRVFFDVVLVMDT